MAIRSFIRTLLLGAAAGAAAVYFNDPDRGEKRREQFANKASSAMEGLNQATDDVKDLADQARQDAGELADEARDRAEDLAGEMSGQGQGPPITLDQPGQTTSSGPDSLLMPGDRRP
ncbi:hypothetical protein BH23ACT9_BH23ACT9_32330 [soil metagenome]